MLPTRKPNWMSISWVGLLCLCLSCTSGPSEKDIVAAVSRSLQQRVPVSMARHLTGGQNATVAEVKVLAVGKAQGEGDSRYWPVKVFASGTCVKMFGGREPFQGEAEFLIRENAYGEWVASPKGL